MGQLQGDIDALEREKTELRERVKELSRKNLMEGIVRQSSAGPSDLHRDSKKYTPLNICTYLCQMLMDFWNFLHVDLAENLQLTLSLPLCQCR